MLRARADDIQRELAKMREGPLKRLKRKALAAAEERVTEQAAAVAAFATEDTRRGWSHDSPYGSGSEGSTPR